MGKTKRYSLESIVVEDFAAEGKCIARHEGEVIFIEGNKSAPQDVLSLLVTRRKNRFSEAIVEAMISPSPMRIEPKCVHFGTCGGCKWQHIPYQEQLHFKQKQVSDQLSRIGRIDTSSIMPIVGSKEVFKYRNKLEFSFSNSRWFTKEEIASQESLNRNAFGFHVPKRFEKVIEIEECWLQPYPSNEIRNFVRAFVNQQKWTYYDHVAHKGFMRSMMLRNNQKGEVMLLIQFAEPEHDAIKMLLDALVKAFPEISSLNFVVNQKGNDTFHDLEVITYSGKSYLEEEMEGLTFKIGTKSFFQTNTLQAYELYKITRNFAQITPNDVVYDLYTGIGTIANFVAKNAKKVIGIEYVAEAIEDAKENAKLNQIENTAFFAGDMKKLLFPDFIAQHGQPDVVITDPPRAGMDAEVIQVLIQTNAKRIVYVSCNPATQARDLALLSTHYEVKAIQPVDMFPHTHHVENVVLLEKIQA